MIALPFLESLLPKRQRAYAASAAPLRFLSIHFPIGAPRNQWNPSGTENNWTLGQTQQSLLPYKNDITMITGVSNPEGGSHTAGSCAFMTGVGPTPDTHSIANSADQVIASLYAGKTPLRSLELGTLYYDGGQEGFDPILEDHDNWLNGTPLPQELTPSKAFNRMFSQGVPAGTGAAAAAKRLAYRKSVLDSVSGQAQSLQARLGKTDAMKLDQYLSGVRELEMRITSTPVGPACQMGNAPTNPMDLQAHMQQNLDLMVLAVMCDITRVVTVGFECSVTECQFPWLGVNTGYHIGVTHCGSTALCDTSGNATSNGNYVKINTWFCSQLAYVLGKLKAIPEAGGTVLDNSVVYFCSELGDGSLHSPGPLPMIVGGHAGGKIKAGRLLDRSGAQNGQVLLALAQLFGSTATTMGNATSPIAGLGG